jgi:hypothetical protein
MEDSVFFFSPYSCFGFGPFGIDAIVSKNGGFDDQYDFLRLFFSPLQQDLSE